PASMSDISTSYFEPCTASESSLYTMKSEGPVSTLSGTKIDITPRDDSGDMVFEEFPDPCPWGFLDWRITDPTPISSPSTYGYSDRFSVDPWIVCGNDHFDLDITQPRPCP